MVQPSVPDINDFTVGIICALEIEYKPVKHTLDETFELPTVDNKYSCGRMGRYNVVITRLSWSCSGNECGYGTISACLATTDMKNDFPGIQVWFMVGIGGGVPLPNDVRLGDVVVGTKIIPYRFGKETHSGFVFTGIVGYPPPALLDASQQLSRKLNIADNVSAMFRDDPTFKRPSERSDCLYKPNFLRSECTSFFHRLLRINLHGCCSDHSQAASAHLVSRSARPLHELNKIHHGFIVSDNVVMKDAQKRDSIAEGNDALCFEMESAGLVKFKCLTVRGICDYADSHKDKKWQPYAAAAAATYVKELLKTVDATVVYGAKPTPVSCKLSLARYLNVSRR